jgi:hypothetical protein
VNVEKALRSADVHAELELALSVVSLEDLRAEWGGDGFAFGRGLAWGLG